MIKTRCFICGKIKFRSPSKVYKRSFCSRKCYSSIRDKELPKNGIKTRLTGKEKFDKVFPKNSEHHFWKGDKVSYRGLHQWVIREKGYATICSHCGKESFNHREIQWANVDHKYRRILDDYISLCKNCHILYDKNLEPLGVFR